MDWINWLSTSSWQLCLVLLVVFLLTYNYVVKSPWRKLPPGPPCLPLLGSLPFLGTGDLREALMTMAAKYGPMFTVYLGNTRVVVLADYTTIRDAFARMGMAFSGRPNSLAFGHIRQGFGLVSSEGDFGRQQRRHCLHILRDLGLGRPLLEEMVQEEVTCFIRELRTHTGTPYDPKELLQMSAANVILSVIFGNRMEYEDPKFVKQIDIVRDSLRILGHAGILNNFPFLRHLPIPGDPFEMKLLMRGIDYQNAAFDAEIKQHMAERAQGPKPGQPRDFIAAYLQAMETDQDNPDTTFSVRQLVATLSDLLGAGTETASTTLTWTMIYMALHQDVQDKVHAEIDEVMKPGETPSMDMRASLPYTEATILEVQRISDVAPIGVPHNTTEDVHFRGRFIPKDTMIIALQYSAHMDPQVWPEPQHFDPLRFINEDGKVVRKEQFMPFSVGKRACLGEGLARVELFICFVAIMTHFRIRPAVGVHATSLEGITSTSYTAKSSHVLLEDRTI